MSIKKLGEFNHELKIPALPIKIRFNPYNNTRFLKFFVIIDSLPPAKPKFL